MMLRLIQKTEQPKRDGSGSGMELVVFHQESRARAVAYLLPFLILTAYLKNNVTAQVIPSMFTIKNVFTAVLQHADEK